MIFFSPNNQEETIKVPPSAFAGCPNLCSFKKPYLRKLLDKKYSHDKKVSYP